MPIPYNATGLWPSANYGHAPKYSSGVRGEVRVARKDRDLRRVSVSPWTDQRKMAQFLQTVRTDIRATLEAAQRCVSTTPSAAIRTTWCGGCELLGSRSRSTGKANFFLTDRF